MTSTPGPPAGPGPRAGPPGRGALLAGIAGSAVLIAGLTVLARAAGLGRVLAFSGSVGAGCTGTVYAAANQIPNVLFEVVAGGALAGAVVPLVAGYLGQGRREDADRVTSALLTWTVLVLLPVSALLALAATPVSRLLLGPGGAGCPEGIALGARMLVAFAPQVVLYGVGVVVAGTLQAHRRFGAPAVAPLLSSAVVVVAYLLFGALAAGAQRDPAWIPGREPELVLSVGTTIGVAALSLPLLWPLRRTGTRLRPTLRFPDGAAARARALAAAGLAALLAQQAAVLVTVILATRVGGTGAVNAWQYAQTVYLLPYAVLAVPIATAAFPRLSEQAARHPPGPGGSQAPAPAGEEFAGTVAASTRALVVVSLAGAAVLVAVAPAVQGFFQGLDRVGGPALDALSTALVLLAVGLVGWALVAHLGRALYAAGAGRSAATATAAGWATVAATSLAAVAWLGAREPEPARAAVLGLAAGNTLGMLVAGLLLLPAVRRVAGPGALHLLGRTAAVAAAALAVAAVLGRLVTDAAHPADGGTAGAALAAAAGGTATLLAGLALLQLTPATRAAGLLRRRPAAGPAPGGAPARRDGPA